MAEKLDTTKITAQKLDKMVEKGKAVMVKVMPGQWEIKVDGKSVGSVNTDHLTGEVVVTYEGSEIGRFTDK